MTVVCGVVLGVEVVVVSVTHSPPSRHNDSQGLLTPKQQLHTKGFVVAAVVVGVVVEVVMDVVGGSKVIVSEVAEDLYTWADDRIASSPMTIQLSIVKHHVC